MVIQQKTKLVKIVMKARKWMGGGKNLWIYYNMEISYQGMGKRCPLWMWDGEE